MQQKKLYLSNKDKKKITFKRDENNNLALTDSESSIWHKFYDGRFGYIISGHNSNLKGPKFYNYSCNIDTGVFSSGKLTAVLFGANGREEVFQAIGRAYEQTTA